MNRSESKYFSTAACMDEALLALLEKKDFAYITVKEVCQKAGVNRSTFYLHYESMADLLAESVEYLKKQFLAYFAPNSMNILQRIHDCPLNELFLITPEYLAPYLRYIQEHRRLFQTAVENAATLQLEDFYQRMFQHVFAPILQRYRVPEQDHPYLMAFYLHGLMAIITQWLKQDCQDSPEHVIAVIQRCIVPHETGGEPEKSAAP